MIMTPHYQLMPVKRTPSVLTYSPMTVAALKYSICEPRSEELLPRGNSFPACAYVKVPTLLICSVAKAEYEVLCGDFDLPFEAGTSGMEIVVISLAPRL